MVFGFIKLQILLYLVDFRKRKCYTMYEDGQISHLFYLSVEFMHVLQYRLPEVRKWKKKIF